ncbi:hypothetical protein PAEPH01_0807 [Pancytospora epiphaga]|nr:hypothetical protein PAEPH01_0807 [Pancytospora epiphaga]
MQGPFGTIMGQHTEDRSGEEDELTAPNIVTSVGSYQPAIGSFIGDFSQNSYVFDGVELSKMKKSKEVEVDLVDRDNIDCISSENITTVLSIDNDDVEIGDTDVYMRNTLELFMRLNGKLEILLREKSSDRRIMEECYKRILRKDIKGALSCLRVHVNTDEEEKSFKAFIEDKWPIYSRRIKGEMDSIRGLVIQMKNIFERLLDRLEMKGNECDRLSDVNKKQSIDYSIQLNSLISENDALKDGLITQLKRHGSPEALNSMLAIDLLSGVGKVLEEQTGELVKYRKSLLERDLQLDEFKRRESSLDVMNLSKQLEEFKRTEKRLQNENINFSETIQRLSIRNSKYKQDLVLFNNELKKSFETIRLKNETIERQKKLISLFQDKLSGCPDYPIEELKARRREIDSKIVKEEDYLKRQVLERERIDCDRRLSDFIKLKSKAPN